jgi:pyridoxine 5-phosphate synthase
MNPFNPMHAATRGTALSVNVNLVAYVRNRRPLEAPSVTRAAQLCLEAGAQGITVHPRPDERHIRARDVDDLATLMKAWPTAEFNIEGNPFHNLMDIVRRIRPHQATLVPDTTTQSTSDHGWQLPQDQARLAPVVAELKALGVRVSLFMDPDPQAMAAVRALGADRVELYTEGFARAHAASGSSEGAARARQVLQQYVDAAEAARSVGLGIHAGHDLSRDNLPTLLRAIPDVREVSIGHALIGDALELGYTAAVQAYRRCIDEAMRHPDDVVLRG